MKYLNFIDAHCSHQFKHDLDCEVIFLFKIHS